MYKVGSHRYEPCPELEYGPALTISNAAELSFSTCAMGTCWVISPNFRLKLITCCTPATPQALLHTMRVQ
eukprot:438988-Prorocentrum_lima.AAC.1